MSTDRLVSMANDIAAFFVAEQGEAEAACDVVQHLMRYWAPSMRHALMDHARKGATGLSPVAWAAARQLAARSQPP